MNDDSTTKPLLPRDIPLLDPAPLMDCFGRVEREAAAAYLVLGCRASNTWDAIPPKAVGAEILKYVGEKGYTWLNNPFYNPHFPELIEHGYAEYAGEDEGQGKPVRFTAKGFQALGVATPQTKVQGGMTTITEYIEEYAFDIEDDDEVTVEVDLGLLKRWAEDMEKTRESYRDLERLSEAAIGKLNREIKELRERLAEEA